jgi:carbon-monoxide dehydrogenase large subunit
MTGGGASPAGIGSRRRRVEDPPLVQGRGPYAGDVHAEGLAHLVALRSPLGHARIVRMDVTQARAAPGVLTIWTAADLPAQARHLAEDRVPPGLEAFPRPVLAHRTVRYTGEILAAVVAETAAAAQDAAEAVDVELESLPAAGSLEAAIAEGTPLVHPELATNVGFQGEAAFGDAEAAFADAPVVVHRRLRLGRVQGAAIEPRATTAKPDGPEVWVWTSTQSVFSVRERVAHALGIEPEQVVVVAEDVGGGFGPKGRTYPEEILTVLAAAHLGRPVRFVATRSEDSASTVHGHGTLFDVSLAADRDGRLRGLRGAFWHDAGAYASIGAGIPVNIAAHMVSGYRLPAMRIRHHVVFTNGAPTGTVRGGGRPEGDFVIERLMDALADTLSLPRDDVRRRNLIPVSEMPYATGLRSGPMVQVYDSGDYAHLLGAAVRRMGPAEAPPSGWVAGVGLAFASSRRGSGAARPPACESCPTGPWSCASGRRRRARDTRRWPGRSSRSDWAGRSNGFR